MNRYLTAMLLLVLPWITPAASGQFDTFPTPAASGTKAIDHSINTDPLNYCKVTIIDEISVPAREGGVLDELKVREGEYVEKGDVLGTIDRTDAVLALAVATHEYAAAKQTAENPLSIKAAVKAYEVALAEYESSLEANEKHAGLVMETELRRQKLQADRAKMQAELASHELLIANLDAKAKYEALQRAQAALDRRQIVSRINGVVVKSLKHEGEWVQPGEPVMRIVQMDRLRVEGEIDGRKYARHEVIGRPVRITVFLTGGGQETLEGKIVYASSIVESNEYTVRAEIDNRKLNGRWLLTPGLNAKMELLSGGAPAFGGILNN